jgi:hypothetical protein
VPAPQGVRAKGLHPVALTARPVAYEVQPAIIIDTLKTRTGPKRHHHRGYGVAGRGRLRRVAVTVLSWVPGGVAQGPGAARAGAIL